MSDDLQYASRADNKRKFDDPIAPPSSAPPPRRSTGFSAPITSPPSDSQTQPSYNSVPPPADEIQLAKQRAQEIAARLFNNAEAKRPRVENGGDDIGVGDHASKPSTFPISSSQSGSFGLGSQTGSYGYQGTSKKIDIPNGRVGVIIGKSGETIKYLQLQSGAKIQVTRDMDADPNSQTRPVELMGTPEQISKAEQLINDVLSEAEAGGSGILAARRFNTATPGTEQFVMKVPNNKVGLIIGKGGETIKNMQSRSGARIQIIPLHLPPGDTSAERTVQMDGTKEQIEIAKQLVNEVCSDNRARNPPMSGYSQQGYQPPRPPTSWGPPGPPPMQQPGYGYMQPGAYPGPPPQYNMPQQPYGSYPPQQTSSGFSSGWDQTSGAPAPQSSHGGGYDYYNQQQQQQPAAPGGSTAPADGSTYGYGQAPPGSYNQQPSYGESGYSQPAVGQPQSYGQDGYGGYQAPAGQPAYGQQPPNPQSGYDQQQTYGSAPSYGNKDGAVPSYGSQVPPAGPPSQTPPPTSQPPAVGAPPQGYSQPPSTTPNYPSQAPNQPYGMPPSQPGYAAQPPSQQGYGQSTLAQPGYNQQPAAQKPPGQMGYGQSPASQGGYPAPTQPGYAHSQTAPAPTGYAQPDPNQHRTAPSYGSSQGGYGQQPYGAPAPTQAGYGQQSYGDSYNAYSQQPPAYSGEGSAGGNSHSGYDAPPPGAAAGAPPAVKTSPQSQ
ncbi:uncharacterized protein LOC116256216 [Nymphaea colorata]|nr:uncharacterized protein LOC116256216 [Nymphaea colorata]